VAERLIFVEEAPIAGRVVAVIAGVTIGRDGCDVLLPDPEVSRHHATLIEVGDGVAIRDEGSLNGTFVNDVQIDEPRILRAGDVVALGATRWRTEEASAATRAYSKRPEAA